MINMGRAQRAVSNLLLLSLRCQNNMNEVVKRFSLYTIQFFREKTYYIVIVISTIRHNSIRLFNYFLSSSV